MKNWRISADGKYFVRIGETFPRAIAEAFPGEIEPSIPATSCEQQARNQSTGTQNDKANLAALRFRMHSVEVEELSNLRRSMIAEIVKQCIEDCATLGKQRNELLRKNHALEAQIASLGPWMNHYSTCASAQRPGAVCDCGLASVLKKS